MKIIYTFDKNCLGQTGCLSNLYYLVTAQASGFFIHHLFPNTVSQDNFSTLTLIVQYFYELSIYQNVFTNFSFKIAPSKTAFQKNTSSKFFV